MGERKISNNSTIIRTILSVLSKKGSLDLLKAADRGFKTEVGKWENFDLSKRQYYTRIRKLKKTGLIKKENNNYIQTSLGKKVSQVLTGFETISEKIEQTKQGKRDEKTHKDEKEIENLIIKEETPNLNEKLVNARIVDILEDLPTTSKHVVKFLQNAEEEILLASRFTDNRIIKAAVNMEKEINFKGVISERKVNEMKECIDSLWDLDSAGRFAEVTRSSIRMCPEIPYCFAVKDQEKSIFEVKNPVMPSEFCIGFVVESEEINQHFRDLFNDLYKEADKGPIEDLVDGISS